MDSLLTPDLGLIVWTIVIFVLLLALLGRFGWKPLLRSLQDREEGIRKAIDGANQAQLDAQALKTRLDKDLAESQSRMQAMMKQAQADAQAVREQMLKDAQAEVQRLSEQTRRQLDEEKAKLMRDLRQQVAGLSLQVAEKLLRHSLNAKENDALIQDILKDLDKEVRSN